MNRRLIVRPEAEADITDGALWYDSHEPGLGLELISEVKSAIARALTNPESFKRVRSNPVVRRVLTRRFPYLVDPSCLKSIRYRLSAENSVHKLATTLG